MIQPGPLTNDPEQRRALAAGDAHITVSNGAFTAVHDLQRRVLAAKEAGEDPAPYVAELRTLIGTVIQVVPGTTPPDDDEDPDP